MLVLPLALYGQSAPAAAFACPASIAVTETAAAAPPWQGEKTTSVYQFLRPSIYTGSPGKDEAELAPDETQTQGKQVTQIWKLSDYRRENTFLRCRYENTAVTVVSNLPAPLKT